MVANGTTTWGPGTVTNTYQWPPNGASTTPATDRYLLVVSRYCRTDSGAKTTMIPTTQMSV